MIIKVDEKGREALIKLLDIALKVGGIESLNSVNEITSSISMLEEVKKDGS